MKYAFIKAHRHEHKVRTLCRVIGVHRSGFYAWCREPLSRRGREDVRQTGLIKQFWIESGGIYGYRKIHDDMREVGEPCGKHRVYRLMRLAQLRSQTGYRRRRPNHKAGKPSSLAPNRLDRQFEIDRPNAVWVTDITFIRTYEGWLYLAIVLDLFARKVVGWSMAAGSGVTYPRCIDGEGACPPEDCGGVSGYERLCRVLADPEHPEYEEKSDWLDGSFDPEAFHPGKVRFDDPETRLRQAFSPF